MILLLMLFWNMPWELSGVHMVCPFFSSRLLPVGVAYAIMSSIPEENSLKRSYIPPLRGTNLPHLLATLSLRSKSLSPSDRSRPHRMRRSNSVLRSTPSLRIRLYTTRFTSHAILGPINPFPTYLARGK